MLSAEQRKIIVLYARRKAFGSRLKSTAGVFELCTIHPEVFAARLFLQIELHACFFINSSASAYMETSASLPKLYAPPGKFTACKVCSATSRT